MTTGISRSYDQQTYLRDGASADICGHRLELWVSGQVQLVVPEQLQKTNGHGPCFSLLMHTWLLKDTWDTYMVALSSDLRVLQEKKTREVED